MAKDILIDKNGLSLFLNRIKNIFSPVNHTHSELEDRIETMEAFWSAAQADGTEGNVIDTLKEIQEYIASDESGASAMLSSINKNSEDIENILSIVEQKSQVQIVVWEEDD